MKRNYADAEEAAKGKMKVKWRLQKEQEERLEERGGKEERPIPGSGTDGAASAKRTKVVAERSIKGYLKAGIEIKEDKKDNHLIGYKGKKIKEEYIENAKEKIAEERKGKADGLRNREEKSDKKS